MQTNDGNKAQGTMDDLMLMARSAAGDRKSFGLIVSRHAGAVRGVARSITGDVAAADDVVQQVFISAFRAASTFRGEGSLRSWLFTITRNAAYRIARKHSKEVLVEEPLAELGVSAGWSSTDPETLMIAAQQKTMVAEAMSLLSTADREVIQLRDIEQLSGPETARLLCVEVSAMKSRLHRARLRLAVELRACWEDTDE